MKRSFLAVSLVILFALAGAPAGGSAGEGVEPLYFAPRYPVGVQFSTFPPNATEPVALEPTLTVSPRFFWIVNRPQVLEDWTLPGGETVVVDLYFGRLDDTVPIDARSEVPQVARFRVDVELFIGGGSMDNTVTPDIRSPGSAAASGVAWFDPPKLGGEAEPYVHLEFDVPEDVEAPAEDSIDIRVTLHGVSPAEARPVMFVYSDEKASRAEVPGFPVAALRALEETEREERRCNQLILEGRSCFTPTSTPTGATGESSAISAVLAASAVLLCVHLARRRHP